MPGASWIRTQPAAGSDIVLGTTNEVLGRTVQVMLNRAGFESLAVADAAERPARAAACVIVAPRLDGGAERLLAAMRSRRPALPVVLVTDSDPDNAKRLGGVLVDEVVWSDGLQHLSGAVQRTASVSLHERFARALERHIVRESDRFLLDRFANVSRSGPPIPSVAELAAQCFLSQSQLERRISAGLGARWTPHKLLSWILLLSTLDLLAEGLGLDRAAYRAGAAPSTIRRVASRLTGVPLAELRRRPFSAFDKAIEDLGTRR